MLAFTRRMRSSNSEAGKSSILRRGLPSRGHLVGRTGCCQSRPRFKLNLARMTACLLGRDDRVPQPQNGSRMTFPRFDTSRIATGLTVGGIASSSMRSRLRLAFAPAVFGALRDLRNNYAAALALAGALQCAAAALGVMRSGVWKKPSA